MSKPLLIFAYGQSNADRYIAKPRLHHPVLEDERIVTLSSGLGVRGRGFHPDGQLQEGRRGDFRRNGRRIQPKDMDEVMPATFHEIQGTSLLHAAGAVAHHLTDAPLCAVRAASKGGLRFCSLPNREGVSGILRLADNSLSPILTGLVEDATQLADHLAQVTGTRPDRCDILFVHGEADRSTPAETYFVQFREARHEVGQRLTAQGLKVRWIVTQPAGTSAWGDGNAWQSRRGLLMALTDDPSLVFAGPLYPYTLDDHIHYDAISKALIGELCGRIIAHLDAGEPWFMPLPVNWHIEGDVVYVSFEAAEPLVIDPNAGAVGLHGFETPKGPDIVAVEVENPLTIAIRLATVPTSGFQLNYAFHRPPRSNSARPSPDEMPRHAAGRGSLRTAWAEPSLLVSGKTLHKWVPGFTLAIDPAVGHGAFVP